MQTISTFNFTDYPELKKVYRKLVGVGQKLNVAIDRNDGDKEDELFALSDKLRYGEVPECIFNSFNGKVKYVYHRKDGKEKWSNVFGSEYSDLTELQKKFLVGLIDSGYIYRLPPEYYDESLKFQKI